MDVISLIYFYYEHKSEFLDEIISRKFIPNLWPQGV